MDLEPLLAKIVLTRIVRACTFRITEKNPVDPGSKRVKSPKVFI